MGGKGSGRYSEAVAPFRVKRQQVLKNRQQENKNDIPKTEHKKETADKRK